MNKSRLTMLVSITIVLSFLAFYGGLSTSSIELQKAESKAASNSSNHSSQIASSDPMLNADEGVNTTELYYNVYQLVKNEYVDKLDNKDDKKLSYGTIRGMLAYLENPGNRLLEPEEVKAREDALRGQFNGIGAYLTTDHRFENGMQHYVLEVITPMPGSPAEKAGLKPDDVIDAVNGRWVLSHNIIDELEPLRKAVINKKATQSDYAKVAKEAIAKQENAILISEAVKILSQPSDQPIKLTIKRAGVKNPIEVTILAAATNVDPIDYHLLNEKWGYIQVRLVNEQAASDFATAVMALKPRMKALVIDLRDNPGGSEANALKILQTILPANTVVAQLEVHKGDKTKKPLKITTGTKLGIPIVVLTDHGTNNIAEMMTAALREKADAKVIGGATHGDAMVYKPIPMRDGSMVILTTGMYYSPKNKTFSKIGIKPDETATSAGNYGDTTKDVPLQRALALLSKGGV
ncbi:MAG: S41 family peptidase [bacterium]